MADCSDAVPCWIMPTYRVSSCLPATGARVLVVGDQKQVSPTSAFVSEAAVRDLKRSLLASGHPFVEQVLPGRSVFDLAQACFADARCALSHHFRCVPQCIAFSNAQFYHDRLLPRRLPPRSQRLTPALVDVKVPGREKKKGKTNEAEAAAVVAYLAAQLAPGGELAKRGASVCVISLLGVEQARPSGGALERATAAQLARHDVVVGDPASLQGDERDVVLLSLVASPKEAPAQASGYRCDDHCSIAASTAVLEDALGEDRRICVCVGGAGRARRPPRGRQGAARARAEQLGLRAPLDGDLGAGPRGARERKLALACIDARVRPAARARRAPARAAAAGRAARARADGRRRRRRRDPRRAAAPRAAPPKRKPAKPAATQGPKAKKPKSAPKAAAAKPKKAAKKRRASDDDSDGEWDGD
ncbi:DNA replication ATP-dependent helicase/nuclease [Aureococcus anophagefferens]|uniref:DNA replication ATP-dependent helicase/nuclease n=1 Tax=Aureococcus anophagefferens TaxID=44056 RepID=A0ABR1FM49_AURAN